MTNSFQTSNGASYLARQTTDMAPITVDTTVMPLAMSNITRSDMVFVENLLVEKQDFQRTLPVENIVFKHDVLFSQWG